MRIPVITTLALAAISCGGNDSSGPDPEIVSTIALSVPAPSMAVREVLTVDAVFRDARGRPLYGVDDVQWSSSNPAMVSVSQTGDIEGKMIGGPVTISATVDDVTASVAISVVPRPALTPDVRALGIDSSVTAAFVFRDFLGATIATPAATWLSSNTAVARVDGAGRIIGVGAGFATISAAAEGYTASSIIEVGRVSPNDGLWRGVPFAQGPFADTRLTMTVLFGEVRGFEMPLVQVRNVFSVNGAQTVVCTAPLVAVMNSAAGATVSLSGSYGATIQITFGERSAAITTGSLSVAGSSFSCSASFPQTAVTVPATSFVAAPVGG